jgi:hypothetical protein
MDGDVREEVDGIDLVLFFSDMLCFVQLKEGGHHIPAWYCILILNARVWEYHILVWRDEVVAEASRQKNPWI